MVDHGETTILVGICRELSLFNSILNMFQAEFGSV